MQTSGTETCLYVPECSPPYAKAVQTSGTETCLYAPECSPPYAKAVQTSGTETCLYAPECSPPYAKAVQTSGTETCLYAPECSPPYAKAVQTSGTETCLYAPECSPPYAKLATISIKNKNLVHLCVPNANNLPLATAFFLSRCSVPAALMNVREILDREAKRGRFAYYSQQALRPRCTHDKQKQNKRDSSGKL